MPSESKAIRGDFAGLDGRRTGEKALDLTWVVTRVFRVAP